jgi:hypothetical protein
MATGCPPDAAFFFDDFLSFESSSLTFRAWRPATNPWPLKICTVACGQLTFAVPASDAAKGVCTAREGESTQRMHKNMTTAIMQSEPSCLSDFGSLRSYVPLPKKFLVVSDTSRWNIANCVDKLRTCRPMTSSLFCLEAFVNLDNSNSFLLVRQHTNFHIANSQKLTASAGSGGSETESVYTLAPGLERLMLGQLYAGAFK